MTDQSDSFSTYCLYIQISRKISINIGKLGKVDFPKGIYLYCGSARKNFDARINRHLTRNKKIRWHIDYLLGNKYSKIIKIEKFKLEEHTECSLVKYYVLNNIAEKYVIGFGASDCQNGCRSHLLKLL
ncbi:MAG: GIY-YIG nuclease family protein [Ignavibacteria bacterium]|nr:GIY-YIG nuclease family protein [Ignavibacteria bacterium]